MIGKRVASDLVFNDWFGSRGEGFGSCGEFFGALFVEFGGELDVDFWGDERIGEARGFAGESHGGVSD